MKKMAMTLGFLAVCASVASHAETRTMSFDTVNVALGSVKNNLPGGCKLERAEPVVVSRNPVKVIYTYVLSKGGATTQISFEQSQDNFIFKTDDATFESLETPDKSFYLKLNGAQQVEALKINGIICSK